VDKDVEGVQRLRFDDKEVVLLGTAHVSRQSAELVAEVIRREKPDTVCVELCASRYEALMNPEAWRQMDIVRVIKEKRAFFLLGHLLLASFQKRVAERLGVTPGGEMIKAVEEAGNIEAAVLPVDREIRTTLARVWRHTSLWAKTKLVAQIFLSLGEAEKITEQDVERLKEKDALELLIEEMGSILPAVRTILIDERDLYMVEKIRNAPGSKVVAVVGAGHVPGIRKHWQDPVDLGRLEEMPRTGRLGRLLKWALPLMVLAVFVYGFVAAGHKAGIEMLGWWVLANGALAGLGALLALAHPLTVLSAVAAAPLTSLNPMIAAGWVSGLVEAFSRKPRVGDMERLSDDILSLKGFWKNHVTRILLVVVFTNLGSSLGTFVALPLMFKAFSGSG